MKRWLALLLLGAVLVGCSKKQERGIIVTDRGQKIAVGSITRAELLGQFPRFRKSFQTYSPHSLAVDSLKAWNRDLDVLIILGTWCPDSRREVGRFLRIMDAAKNPHFHLRFVGVDRTKRDPGGVATKYNIKRVPTFIVLLKGKEVGRIVERPKTTLERDFLAILHSISASS